MYHNVFIRDGIINENLLSSGSNLSESDINFEDESDHELESAANHLRAHSHVANESLVLENENLLELILGQGKKTKPIFL